MACPACLPDCYRYRVGSVAVIVIVIVIAALPYADLLRLTGQLQDVHPIADAVDDDDAAAVVDFDVVGHIGAVGSGRYIEPRLHGPLWVGDVPRAHAGVEVRG